MFEEIAGFFKDKAILILGFGKEGRSTYNFLQSLKFPTVIGIADKSPDAMSKFEGEIPSEIKIYSGERYLDCLNEYDLVIKSPGIPKELVQERSRDVVITSQTNLFLRFFRNRIIGITGTKGKSTTSSLIRLILFNDDGKSFLVGNIGLPPFDYIGKIDEDAWIVYELSSHQLDDVEYSPHIAVFLNLFEEHLDHYGNFENYRNAKANIFRFQRKGDYLILNFDDKNLAGLQKGNGEQVVLGYSFDHSKTTPLRGNGTAHVQLYSPLVSSQFDFSGRSSIPGQHNLKNIMAAVAVAKLLQIRDEQIISSVNSFKGLEHRLEYVGTFKGIQFYNDSIATVPEATIEAVKTLKNIDTLILGGKDRGIDYSILVDFLPLSGIRNLIFMGEAGKRIMEAMKTQRIHEQQFFPIHKFPELAELIPMCTKPGKICLLSPAASSYDWFYNFEERGRAFKKIAENL